MTHSAAQRRFGLTRSGACLLLLFALMDTGCSGKSDGEKEIAAAQERVAKNFFDPASAQFKNVKTFPTGAVCGSVNAKNRFGGYVGFRDFVLAESGALYFEPHIEQPGNSEEAELAKRQIQNYLQLRSAQCPGA